MQPHDQLSRAGCRNHDVHDLFQRHGRTVVDRAALFFVFQQGRIDQRTGINDHIRLFQQLGAAYRDEIGCA